MSLMLRLLSISLIATLSFSATDKQIEKFVKRGLSKNPSIKVEKITIIDKQPLKNPKGWEAYFINFKLKLKRGKKNLVIDESDILFVKGDIISPDFIDLKTNRSLKHYLSPKVKKSFYDKEHLLYGKENAKHKMLIFSDPNCPFCKEIVPDIIDVAKKYPDIFALYYYHLPLTQLHPAAYTISKAMIIFHKNGKKDLIKKIYELDFDYSQKDEKRVLEELNKKLGTELTLKDIDQKWVEDRLKLDMKRAKELMVKGTPTLFIDGKKDPSREKYRDFIPKK